MKGDVHKCTTVCSAASHYATDSGFYLIAQRHPVQALLVELEEMLAVMLKFIDGLVHIGQRGMALLLLE